MPPVTACHQTKFLFKSFVALIDETSTVIENAVIYMLPLHTINFTKWHLAPYVHYRFV